MIDVHSSPPAVTCITNSQCDQLVIKCRFWLIFPDDPGISAIFDYFDPGTINPPTQEEKSSQGYEKKRC